MAAQGVPGPLSNPLPSRFLHVSLVDLVSVVDGSDSAFGGVAGDDLGTETGRVSSMEEQDASRVWLWCPLVGSG